jgi:hypothetical protein
VLHLEKFHEIRSGTGRRSIACKQRDSHHFCALENRAKSKLSEFKQLPVGVMPRVTGGIMRRRGQIAVGISLTPVGLPLQFATMT